jgi:Holliday junction resolvase RusA-like endonuclease
MEKGKLNNDNIQRRNRVQHPVKEESQNVNLEQGDKKATNDHRPQKAKANQVDSRCIVIIVRHSDFTASDIDNQVTTILDCLAESGKIVSDSIRQIGSVVAVAVKVAKGREGFDAIIT